MKKLKLNYQVLAFLLSALGALGTSAQSNLLYLCTVIPTASGPSINQECPYAPTVLCCYISAGSSFQYIMQTQNGSNVVIKRDFSQMTTILGIRQ